MVKNYDCVMCGHRKPLYKSVDVKELLKIKPNLKNLLWYDMRKEQLKKRVKLCRSCIIYINPQEKEKYIKELGL